MSERRKKIVLTFKSATDAAAMELNCRKEKILGRIVPVPRSISASCGLCYICNAEQEESLLELASRKQLAFEGQYYRDMF